METGMPRVASTSTENRHPMWCFLRYTSTSASIGFHPVTRAIDRLWRGVHRHELRHLDEGIAGNGGHALD